MKSRWNENIQVKIGVMCAIGLENFKGSEDYVSNNYIRNLNTPAIA